MKTGSVADRMAIRDLIEAFSAANMRYDHEAWGALWAEDGVWKLPSMEHAVGGRAAIVELFKEKTAYVRFAGVTVTSSDLLFDGDRAVGNVYCQETLVTKAGPLKVVVGWFEDQYVKQQGRWLFKARTFRIIGAAEG